MATQKTKTVTKVEPFKLDLPPELDIKPDYVVVLPAGYTASVYKISAYTRARRSSGVIDERADPKFETLNMYAYRVLLRNRHGNRPSRGEIGYGDVPDKLLGDVIDVRVHIEYLAAALTKQSKTTIVENDFEG